ncbi:MAG: guanylate kinase, partial [Spirochaetae bacterium HGW-Spirochaetae-6]
GKTTIAKKIVSTREDVFFSVSTTTRMPRKGEVEGVHYYFVKEGEFKDKIERGEFLEWARVFNNFYGTTRLEVERIITSGKYCLLDIDVQGALQIREQYPGCKAVFILPPSLQVLEKRLQERGDTDAEQMSLRLAKSKEELSFINYYDYYIVNDSLEDATRKVIAVLDPRG